MNKLFHYFLCPSSRFIRIILIEKKIDFNLDDMNNLKFSEKITSSGYQKNSYVYNLITSLREKINSPVKRKQRKR